MERAGNSGDDGHSEADKDRLIKELREAIRAREEFVAIAAHELRNPMTPILMQVSGLLAAVRNPSRCRPEVITPMVELLELALEQVTDNLLSNAIKFGAGMPVTIALRSDGRNARLTVRDRGIGIPEGDRTRIFERFERAVTKREHGGFGVGLWLANQLVVAMGGAMAVESTPGEGTTFTVTLPLGGAE